MEVGLSTCICPRVRLEDALPLISRQGVSRVELATFNFIMSSRDSRLKKDYLAERNALRLREEDIPLKEILEIASSLDVGIVQVHAPEYCLCEPDDRERMLAVEKTGVMLSVCSRIGARFLVVHIGNLESIPEGYESRIGEKSRESLRPLAKMASDLGVKIALENGWRDGHGSSVQDLIRIIEETDPEHVCVCLDVGHCQRIGNSPSQMVRALGDHLGTTHIHDYDGERDHIPPFSGIIDWEGLASALCEVQYGGVLMGEIEGSSDFPGSPNQIRSSLKAMERLLDECSCQVH